MRPLSRECIGVTPANCPNVRRRGDKCWRRQKPEVPMKDPFASLKEIVTDDAVERVLQRFEARCLDDAEDRRVVATALVRGLYEELARVSKANASVASQTSIQNPWVRASLYALEGAIAGLRTTDLAARFTSNDVLTTLLFGVVGLAQRTDVPLSYVEHVLRATWAAVDIPARVEDAAKGSS